MFSLFSQVNPTQPFDIKNFFGKVYINIHTQTSIKFSTLPQ